MTEEIISKTLYVDGMTCSSCELRIEKKLKKLKGITEVQAKYAEGIVKLSYNSEQIELEEIIKTIESLDYTVKLKSKQKNSNENEIKSLLGIGIIIFAVYFLVENTIGFNFIPEVNQNMGYGILFVVGLFTSLHCIAMCGGINLSQCVAYKIDSENKLSKLKPSILYNAGRVISYTIIGGIVGAIGSVISLSGMATGFVSILAGVFMIIMGLNMLNIFPQLRKLMPRMPKFIGTKIYNNNGIYAPFYVGLLNGFMPCGPLQSMQIYALGTGSFVSGALSMFSFSLGTIPLMFGFGAVSTMLNSKFTHKMMNISAVLVMILGIIMLNRGFSLSGIDPVASISSSGNSSSATSYRNAASISDGVQYVTTQITNGRYSPITVQKGLPVKWTIQVGERGLNGCNNPMVIREYGMEIKLTYGDNLIEFTPEESGVIPYSCWMGMIRNQILVVDDLSSQEGADSSYSSISTDEIVIASVVDDIQEVTVKINKSKFSPGIIVLQEGLEFIFKFDVEELDETDEYGSVLYFLEYQGGIDLLESTETPPLPAVGDFSFQDIEGSKRVFVKVVADINNIDKEAIVREAQNYADSLDEWNY